MAFELAKAYVTVMTNMSALKIGMQEAQTQVTHSVDAMQTSLNTLSGTLRTVAGMFGVSLGIYGMYQLGKSIIFASDATAMLRNSFITMYKGSEEQADALIKRMKEFAATTPFEEAQVSRAIMMFKPFSANMDDMFETIRKIGDAASTSAQGLQAFPRVALAISQMFGKTKISAQEMQQMAEGGVPAWEALARSQGKSVAEVMKLSAAGKLGTDAIRGMIDELGKANAGAMEKQSKTVQGLMSTISDNVKLRAVAAFQPLYEAAQGAMSQIAAYVSSAEFGTLMDAMSTALKVVFTIVTKIGGVVGFIANIVSTLISPFEATLTKMAFILGGVVTGVLALNAAMRVYKMVQTAASAASIFFQSITLGPVGWAKVAAGIAGASIATAAMVVAMNKVTPPEKVTPAMKAIAASAAEAAVAAGSIGTAFATIPPIVDDVQAKLQEYLKMMDDLLGKTREMYDITPALTPMEKYIKAAAEIDKLYSHWRISLEERNRLLAGAYRTELAIPGMKASKEAAAARKPFEERGAAIFRETRNPIEAAMLKFKETMTELLDLRMRGMLAPGVFERARETAMKDYKEGVGPTKKGKDKEKPEEGKSLAIMGFEDLNKNMQASLMKNETVTIAKETKDEAKKHRAVSERMLAALERGSPKTSLVFTGVS